MLDAFEGKISFTEIMSMDAWLLQDLFDAQMSYLDDKRKAEAAATAKAHADAKVKQGPQKRSPRR
jgi:hypothetical protein